MLTGLHTLGGVEILGTIEKLKPEHAAEQVVQIARANLIRARQTLVAAPRVEQSYTRATGGNLSSCNRSLARTVLGLRDAAGRGGGSPMGDCS